MTPRARTSSRRRLTGVDAARGLALLGMMSVHAISVTELTGEASWTGEWLAGRSAALFAVLAGLGLALLVPAGGAAALSWGRKVVAVRAVLIVLIGMLVAYLNSGVAIILVHYGLMFLLALPFLRLGARSLAGLAGAWVVVGPWLYWFWQNRLREPLGPGEHPERLWHSPGLADLFTPQQLVMDLVVTGYYPLLVWPAYFFAGMAIGRLRLRRTKVAAGLAITGAVLAAGTLLLSRLMLSQTTLVQDMSAQMGVTAEAARGSLLAGDHALPLVTDTRWFLVATPHQGSPVELLYCMGVAAAVVGLCVVAARVVPWLLLPLAGAGSMPLSLYVGHLVVLHFWRSEGGGLDQLSPEAMALWLAAGALALGMLKSLLGRRGPLEAVTHAAGTAVAGPRPGRSG